VSINRWGVCVLLDTDLWRHTGYVCVCVRVCVCVCVYVCVCVGFSRTADYINVVLHPHLTDLWRHTRYVCLYVCVCVCVCMYTCTCIFAYTHTYPCFFPVCILTSTHAMHARVQMRVHRHISSHMMHIDTIYVYVCVCVCVSLDIIWCLYRHR